MNKYIDAILYFSHSRKMYNTYEELYLMGELEELFPTVFNPNYEIGKSNILEVYLKAIDSCDLLIVREFLGGVGPGSYKEIKHALSTNKLALVLRTENCSSFFYEINDVDELSRMPSDIFYGKIRCYPVPYDFSVGK